MRNTLWKNPLVVVFFSFALGCISQAVTSSITVAAQSDPAAGIYQECAGIVMDSLSLRERRAGAPMDTTPIPAGWHVVGGGGGGVVICR